MPIAVKPHYFTKTPGNARSDGLCPLSTNSWANGYNRHTSDSGRTRDILNAQSVIAGNPHVFRNLRAAGHALGLWQLPCSLFIDLCVSAH